MEWLFADLCDCNKYSVSVYLFEKMIAKWLVFLLKIVPAETIG